jgi:hypothetical protein
MNTGHFVVAAVAIATGNLALRCRHRAIEREHCNMPALEGGDEDFPIRLGLRY